MLVLFEACSAFTRVTACTLALSPIRDTLSEGFSHFVTSIDPMGRWIAIGTPAECGCNHPLWRGIMQIRPDQPQAPSAIRSDLGAIFVSMELSRSSWLITSLSP